MKPSLLAAAALLCAFAARAAEAPAPYSCPKAPKGWTSSVEDGRTAYVGPQDGHGVAAQIEVSWIGPGDPGRPDADAYVERLTKPGSAAPPGWKTGPVEKTTVAGRAARRVTMETTQFVPPHSRFAKEVKMREEHVVVPAAKGYYVLVYDAPASIAAKNRAAFRAVLAGFKPSF